MNSVSKYKKELKLEPIIAGKAPNLSQLNAGHKKYIYKLRRIEISHVNQVWSTDITYIKVEGSNVYLAAIIVWYSKAILAHSISNTMDAAFVTSVLNEAIRKHGKPEIFNTDQSFQYTSNDHTDILRENRIEISMDGKGRATNNICIERFWRSEKCEIVCLFNFESRKHLKESINKYICFYNFERYHEFLGYLKPMDVYNQKLLDPKIKGRKRKKSLSTSFSWGDILEEIFTYHTICVTMY
ncbi:MAG: DDE-type integrase/transposase/recombinase [Fusobacteria bacterium]|nr:DDE-type integrase/transposase/recombinase [Fusobacteriota bacterium]